METKKLEPKSLKFLFVGSSEELKRNGSCDLVTKVPFVRIDRTFHHFFQFIDSPLQIFED